MIFKNKNGFTLIETMAVIAIGATITLAALNKKNQEIQEEATNKAANKILRLLKATNERMFVDGNSLRYWVDSPSDPTDPASKFNNNFVEIGDFKALKENLIFNGKTCGGIVGKWTPKNADPDINLKYQNYNLIPCNENLSSIPFVDSIDVFAGFSTRNMGIDSTKLVNRIDSLRFIITTPPGEGYLGRLDEMSDVISRDTNLPHDSNISVRFVDTDNYIHNPSTYENDAYQSVDFDQCFNKDTCALEVIVEYSNEDDNLDKKYLRMGENVENPSVPFNGMRGAGYYFQTDDGTNTGVYKFDECDKYTWDSTGKSLGSTTTYCGFTKDGHIIAASDINTELLKSKEINAVDIDAKNIDARSGVIDDISSIGISSQNINNSDNINTNTLKVADNISTKELKIGTRIYYGEEPDGCEIESKTASPTGSGSTYLTSLGKTRCGVSIDTDTKEVSVYTKAMHSKEAFISEATMERLNAKSIKANDITVNELISELNVSDTSIINNLIADQNISQKVSITGQLVGKDPNTGEGVFNTTNPAYESKYIRDDFTTATPQALINKGYVDKTLLKKTPVYIYGKEQQTIKANEVLYIGGFNCLDGYNPNVEVVLGAVKTDTSGTNKLFSIGAWVTEYDDPSDPDVAYKAGLGIDETTCGTNSTTTKICDDSTATLNITYYCIYQND